MSDVVNSLMHANQIIDRLHAVSDSFRLLLTKPGMEYLHINAQAFVDNITTCARMLLPPSVGLQTVGNEPLTQVFENASKLTDALERLKEVNDSLTPLFTQPGLEHLQAIPFVRALSECCLFLQKAIPAIPCPTCQGYNGACSECKGFGYLTYPMAEEHKKRQQSKWN